MSARMPKWTALPLALGFAIAVVAAGGCSGGGSSGFDAAPKSEAAAIARAIDAPECVVFEATTFCGSGVETPLASGDLASVGFGAPADTLVCRPDGETCAASLPFTASGFPAGATFIAASSTSEDGPWMLVATTSPTGGVMIVLPTPTDANAPPASLLVAVLVYEGAPPAGLPSRADRLATFAADLVYVSPRLEVTPER